jgi:hypothetical protein
MLPQDAYEKLQEEYTKALKGALEKSEDNTEKTEVY